MICGKGREGREIGEQVVHDVIPVVLCDNV